MPQGIGLHHLIDAWSIMVFLQVDNCLVPCCLSKQLFADGRTKEGTASTALCSAAYDHKVQDHMQVVSNYQGVKACKLWPGHTVTVPCAVLCAPVLS